MTPKDTQTRFLSCKASQPPSVPRLRWWFFNLSSRTLRYAVNDFCISGSTQVKMDLTQSRSSFSVLRNQSPSYALCVLSLRSSFWAAAWASLNLWRSFATGLGTGSSGSSGRRLRFWLETPLALSRFFLCLIRSSRDRCSSVHLRSSILRICSRCL